MAQGAVLAIVGLIPFLLLPCAALGLQEALGEYNHGPTSIVICEDAVFIEHGYPDGEPPTGKDLQSLLSFLRNL
jgi:hypothetical protein